jgi:hypothetical protein
VEVYQPRMSNSPFPDLGTSYIGVQNKGSSMRIKAVERTIGHCDRS